MKIAHEATARVMVFARKGEPDSERLIEALEVTGIRHQVFWPEESSGHSMLAANLDLPAETPQVVVDGEAMDLSAIRAECGDAWAGDVVWRLLSEGH